ncbi:hypothetical protein B7767_33560 [Streptomyces sp. 13-12-16]|nr:hypothetical protein B7767_33560 [Streptomyces sp. 13-12-16]
MPPQLVGEWDGDGAGIRFDKIRFSADGGVALIFNSGSVLEGIAVADETSLILYAQGGPIHYRRWSVEAFEVGSGYTFENFVPGGVSYVRQASG